MSVIYREVLDDQLRLNVPARIFGDNFPLIPEPTAFPMAERLSPENYRGGLWEFYLLCNGGFYMAPRSGLAAVTPITFGMPRSRLRLSNVIPRAP